MRNRAPSKANFKVKGVQTACSSEGRYTAVWIALPAHFRAGAPEAPQLPG